MQQLDITFRRDPTNFRPRINKYGSVKDQEQKRAGTYYFYDEVAAGAEVASAREKARKELKEAADKEKADAGEDDKATGKKGKRAKGKTKRDDSDED